MIERQARTVLLPILVGLVLLLNGCGTKMAEEVQNAPKVVTFLESAFYEQSVGLRRMAPPHERGIKNIAVFCRSRDEVQVWYRGLWNFRTRSYPVAQEAVLTDFSFEQELRRQAGEAPFVKLRFLTAAEAVVGDHISYNKWFDSRSIDETGLAKLAELRAKGVDRLLLVEEPESLWDFIYKDNRPLPSKGFLGSQGLGTHVVAGFNFVLIDTASGAFVKSSQFQQASADGLFLTLNGHYAIHSVVEQKQMSAALQQRIANNIKFMLQLLKVIPGEDGAFLSYDPVTDKPGGDDYPQ